MSPRLSRITLTLAALSLLAGARAAAENPPAVSPVDPVDPVAPRARLDLLGPFHADAVKPTPVTPASAIGPRAIAPPGSVAVGDACATDGECAGRSYCDLGRCVALQKRTSAILYYHQPGDSGYRFVVPIYWHWWSHDGNGRFVFPFYWHTHDYQTAHQDTWVFLYQHYRDPAIDSHRIWPIFFYSRYGKDGADGSGAGLLPIFYATRNKTRTVGVAPLLLTGWSSDSASGDYRVFSLFSYFSRTGDASFGTVFPLLWHSGAGPVSTTVILPLAFFGHDRARGMRHATFLPFFHYRSSDNGRRKLVFTLLGAYSQSDDAASSQFVGFFPPIYRRRDPKRDIDLVLPLAFRWHDKVDRTTTTVIGPFLRFSDGDGATSVLLPLLFHFHDRAADASTTILFPVAAWHSSPRENGQLIGPFYNYSGPGGWSRGLFPIALFQNRDGRQHQAILPLFLHAADRDAGTETTAVTLGYYRRARDGWDAGLVPLLYAGRHGDVRYGVGFPLYFWKGDAHRSTHVLGPLYLSTGDRGYAVGIAPIIHFGATRTVEGVSHTSWFLPPLWLHTDDAHAHTSLSIIGPVFLGRDGRDHTAGVFPLLWDVDRGARHYFLALPLAARVRDDDQKTDNLWVGPYVSLKDGRAPSTTRILFPIGVKHDAPDYHVVVQFPFFWRVQEGNETDTVVFPFYARMRRPDLAVDVGFPLVWRVKGRDTTTTVVGPAFWRTGKDRTDGGILPIGGFGVGTDRRYAWALPLLFYHASDDHEHTNRTLFGPFLWDRQKDGGWSSALVPLYVGWRRGSVSHVVGSIFYHTADASDGSAFNLLGPFYYGHGPHGRAAGLIPIIFTRTHDDGRWSATVLPVFHAARKADGGTRLITPLFGWSTTPTGTRAYVGPVYFRNDAAGYTASLIPIFYHAHDRLDGVTTTALVPLFFRSATPQTTLTGITPLAWRYTTIEAATTIVFPLFFDQHKYAESRSTGLLPFYIRHKNLVDGSSTQVFPLLYLHSPAGAGPTDVVLFPLFWHLNGKEGARSTALFPLFWDIRRGTSKTQVMFPLYARAVRDDAEHTLFLNFYYRRGKAQREGSYYVNIFPIFSWGRPRPQDFEWDFIGGLVGYSRVGRNRTLTLLFGIPIALEPAPLTATSSGTMFTSNPSLRGGLF